MDLKIHNLQQISQPERITQTPEADGSFRITQLSNIEESELQAALSGMMEEITQQGYRLGKRRDIRDMKQYRKLIQEFMNEIVIHSHMFSREYFLDKHGSHRVYGIVKQVNQALDELAEEQMNEEQDHLAILSKKDEIRGLLLDIFTRYLNHNRKDDRYDSF